MRVLFSFTRTLTLSSKKLLEYACFHKGDVEEADKDRDDDDGNDNVGSGGKGTSEFDDYTHKVIRKLKLHKTGSNPILR